MKQLFHEHFSNIAKKAPDNLALSDENGTLTYQEADEASNAIARELLERGAQPGEAVAVFVSRQKEIVVGAIAALKAGGVFLPLDEAYPEERLIYMMQDASVRFILADRSLWERRQMSEKLQVEQQSDCEKQSERNNRIERSEQAECENQGACTNQSTRAQQNPCTVLFFDDVENSHDSNHAERQHKNQTTQVFQPIPRHSDDPAMILYTSGTTGNPKGVIHRHALLQGVNDWTLNHEGLDFSKKSHMCIMSGFTFVATNVFMFGTLAGGGAVHIAPAQVKQSTAILYSYINQNNITHIFMPSSLAATMAEDYDMSNTSIFAGGEKLRNFKPCSKNTKLYNIYGSTELATIFSARVAGDEDIIPVGRPTKGACVCLVNENLDNVSPGEAGELLVSDARASLEYLNLPNQTKEKWISRDGKIYFRTGDRARQDENGTYYILGRMDNMVKLRGFRIETGEVETQVSYAMKKLHFACAQVVVVVKTVNGIDHLTCYYEAQNECDTKKLTDMLSGFLPAYMLPDLWVRLGKMARNANGKVIRAKLPDPKVNVHFLGAIFSEAELRVAEAAARVLDIAGAIDPDESFVQLGGDSLRAMELSTCLSEQGIKISSAIVLSSTSLREIATEAKIAYERLWSVDEYEAVKCDYLSHGEKVLKVLPLTPRQDDLICRRLIHPDLQAPERRFMFVSDSHIEPDVLRRALDALSQKHAELGASIACRNVSFFQGVITDRKVPLKLMDGRGLNIAQVYEKLQREDCKQPFDMQFSPLFRVALVHLGEAQSCLFIMAHKIAYTQAHLRSLLIELLGLLLENYPNDQELSAWHDMFVGAAKDGEDTAQKNIEKNIESATTKTGAVHDLAAQDATSRIECPKKTSAEDVFFYSNAPNGQTAHNTRKKIFFIHTGNTGSGAYYQLAQRIRDDFTFGVIEPYNLYHPENALSGIENIAAKYIEIIKKYQPCGPYILGGWCYGGVVAHEMACQLVAKGEEVEHLFMLDAHALDCDNLRNLAAPMQASAGRSYFETSPLFKELRENGMIDAVVDNAERVTRDLNTHVPKHYTGAVTYFKPKNTPAAATGDVLKYWEEMAKKQAGNYENYCDMDNLEVVLVPREHDEMMESDSLDIIVPKIYEVLRA